MAEILRTVQDLKPGKEYLLTVRAKNTDLNAYSNSTDSIRFEVPTDTTVPEQVVSVNLYASFQTVMFVFQFVSDRDVSHYEYELYYGALVGGSPSGELVSSGIASSNIFTVSVENSTTTETDSVTNPIAYSGRVRAVDNTGWYGEWSTFVQSDQDTPLIDEQFIGSLTAAKITAGTIGAHTITLNGVNSIIKSSDYVQDTSGWKIEGDGSAEFSGVKVRGDIIADSLYLLQEGSDSIYVGEYGFNSVLGHGILFKDSDWSDPDAIAAFQFSGNPIPSYDQSITQIVNEMQGSASSYLSLSREDYSVVSIKAYTADAGAIAYVESTDTYSDFSLNLARYSGFSWSTQEFIRARLNVSDGTGYLSLSPVASINHIYVGINTVSPDEILHIAYNKPVIKLEDTDTSILSGELSSGIEFYTSDTTNSGMGAFIRAEGVSTTGELRLTLGAGTPGSPSASMYVTQDAVQMVQDLELFSPLISTSTISLSSTSSSAINFSGTTTSISRGISFNGRTAVSADSGDGWLRLNQDLEFVNGVYTRADLRIDGITLIANGSVSTPSLALRNDTDTGIYRPTTNQIGVTAAGANCAIFAAGTTATAEPFTSGTTGYQYVMRNTTYGTLYRYTSMREYKEQILYIDDVGSIIDALKPVTFVPRFSPVQEGDVETENQKILREQDLQYGFIAEDIAEVADGKLAQWEWTEDGNLKPVGWKWQDLISVLVAEIKTLRRRVEFLELST